MSGAADKAERMRRMSERLGQMLSQPLPEWLATSVRNCLIELDRLSGSEPRGLEIAGVLARAESLLSLWDASGSSGGHTSSGG
ncbi:MAG: hypothetical protein JWN44_5202 [Myxococcales bacterium]|nr:hypothetical protein [Myxococcales bacterium]